MTHSHDPVYYIAYAAGFAFGNYVGLAIEEKLALGKQAIRIILGQDAHELVTHMREKGLGITAIHAEGAHGPVRILFTIVNRKDVESVIRLVEKYNPNAFYSIEDVQNASSGIFPLTRSRKKKLSFDFMRMSRKAK